MRTIQTLNGTALNLAGIPRGFIRPDARGRLTVNRAAMYDTFVENNTLREDETREIERTLQGVSRRDLVGVADLMAAGLTIPLMKGIGATTYEYDRVTPVGEATQSMSILSLGDRDMVSFSRTAIPVPVTASQFQLDARHRAAGQSMGEPIDLTNVEEHTRAVAEKLEDTLVNGSNIVLGGNSLPGYTNFSSREQVTFSSAAWSTLTEGARTAAVTDVLTARSALRDNGFTGPYMLYIPANFDGVIDEDYKAESDRTLRQRLLSIDGISQIKVLPSLPDSEVLLVQMTRAVVQMPEGQPITVVTWDEMGGLASNWAILHVGTVALKAANARAPLSAGTLPALTTAAGIAHIS